MGTANTEKRVVLAKEVQAFLKENQELEYIFVGTDSDGKHRKLAKSASTHEKLKESDSNGNGYK